MYQLRQRWLNWVQAPDWQLLDVLQAQFVYYFTVGIMTFVLCGVGAWALPRRVQLVTAIAVLTEVLFLVVPAKVVWRKSRRSPAVPPVKFPPPPSSEWSKAERSYVRSRIFDVCSLAFFAWATIVFNVFLPYLLLVSLDTAGATVTGYIYIAVTLLVGIIAIVGAARVGPTVGRLARVRYREALNALVSPALSRSADLLALADDLKKRALSAEEIVREVDVLFRELEQDVAAKQAEQSALIQHSEEVMQVTELTQAQVDALFKAWTERQQLERRHEKRRDRAVDVVMVIAAAIIGYGLAFAYSPDKLHDLLLSPKHRVHAASLITPYSEPAWHSFTIVLTK